MDRRPRGIPDGGRSSWFDGIARPELRSERICVIFPLSLDAAIRVVAFLAKHIGGCKCSARRTELESPSPSGDDGFSTGPRRSGFRVTKNGNGPFDKDQGLLQGSPWLVKERDADGPGRRSFSTRSVAAPASLPGRQRH